ncbi:GPI mannosyltransferase 4 [Cynocephalus volans]|uniref:GPI mannosyltransferase 4 n=1 Tax=Cynocephalus volans TaxID=110931 RepID=UPI002FC9105A
MAREKGRQVTCKGLIVKKAADLNHNNRSQKKVNISLQMTIENNCEPGIMNPVKLSFKIADGTSALAGPKLRPGLGGDRGARAAPGSPRARLEPAGGGRSPAQGQEGGSGTALRETVWRRPALSARPSRDRATGSGSSSDVPLAHVAPQPPGAWRPSERSDLPPAPAACGATLAQSPVAHQRNAERGIRTPARLFPGCRALPEAAVRASSAPGETEPAPAPRPRRPAGRPAAAPMSSLTFTRRGSPSRGLLEELVRTRAGQSGHRQACHGPRDTWPMSPLCGHSSPRDLGGQAGAGTGTHTMTTPARARSQASPTRSASALPAAQRGRATPRPTPALWSRRPGPPRALALAPPDAARAAGAAQRQRAVAGLWLQSGIYSSWEVFQALGPVFWQQFDLKMATRVLWGSLCLLRVLWCLLPQTGYVHPDEFFQSPEVMAEDILGVQATRPWEFHPSSSCRTVVFPLLTSGSTFWLLRLWEELGPWPGLVTGYVLLVGPRLLLTALSFALDGAMYHLAPLWGADRWNALVLLSGSYVTLVFYTRTFSNAVEGLLFTWLLVLVSPHVARSPTPRKPAPGPWWHSWLLGGIVAAGFFNRPTFLAFALVPLFLWGIRGATNPGFKSLTWEALVLLPGAALTALVFVAMDSWYFSSPSRPSTLVLTPVNFLHYNLDPQNLAQHGTHMRLTHLAVNGFLLFGVLHVQALHAAWQQLQVCRQAFARMGLLRALGAQSLLSSSRSSLLLLYFMPLALLSAFSHQEARFLIPLLVPLVLLCSSQTQPVPWKGTLVLFNALGALFFGCLHQGGLVPGLEYLEQVVHAPVLPSMPIHYTLLFTHTYMPPQHLLRLPGLGSPVEVVDMGGTEDLDLCQALNNFINRPTCQGAGGPWLCRLFVVTPGTTRHAVEKCSFPLKNETLMFPHLTLEDPPALSSLLSEAWRDHLSLHIMELGE